MDETQESAGPGIVMAGSSPATVPESDTERIRQAAARVGDLSGFRTDDSEEKRKAFLAPFSVVPEEHSLAKGTAPAPVRDAFAGWTSVFSNQDPIVLGWFPAGVPSMVQLHDTGQHGVMDVRFRGARTPDEAEYTMKSIMSEGKGCGFALYLGIECVMRCQTVHGWKRCIHYLGTASYTKQDAYRGLQVLRDNLEKASKNPDVFASPDQRWDLSDPSNPRRLAPE